MAKYPIKKGIEMEIYFLFDTGLSYRENLKRAMKEAKRMIKNRLDKEIEN